jgi:hypothetical protein
MYYSFSISILLNFQYFLVLNFVDLFVFCTLISYHKVHFTLAIIFFYYYLRNPGKNLSYFIFIKILVIFK